jgi:hypothetical protein
MSKTVQTVLREDFGSRTGVYPAPPQPRTNAQPRGRG